MEERSQLSRTLKPHWVWAIALGSAVGWGAFILPTDWMGTAGPLGAILGLIIGGLLMMIIAVSYGFLIKSFPVSGGEFAYAYLKFGRDQAFVCGWFLTLGYLSIVALNASALALLGRYVLPGIAEQGFLYDIAGWDVYFGEVMIASLALIFFAWMNIRGATLSGKAQFIFCMIMIVGVALIGIGTLLHPDTPLSNLQPVFSPGIPAWTAILAIVAIAPWAYVGFDNVPQAAEEFDFSPMKAFRLIILAIAVAALLYSVMILATAVATPWQNLVSSQPTWGTGDTLSGLFGAAGIVCLAVAVCMGIFTGLNGFYVSSSRLMFAMGRARILPDVFAKLHSRHNTPYFGIIFTCAICLIAPWFGREALLWVVDMSAVGVTIAYFYTCFAAFRLFRWSDSGADNDVMEGAISPTKKALSLLGTLCGISFLGLLIVPGSPGFLGVQSWVALGVWILLGVIFYLYKVRQFRSIPKDTLDYLIFGEKLEVETSHTRSAADDTKARVE